MKKALKGFTLIELLIVIAILGILAVALLLNINPAESQRKANDVKRQTDLKALATVLDQIITDGVTIPNTCTGGAGLTAGCSSATVAAQGQQACNTNWLGINVCAYTNTVPLDPTNNKARTPLRYNAGVCTPVLNNTMGYKAMISAGNYKAQVQLESQSNCNKIGNDGGQTGAASFDWLEAGSDLAIAIP